MLDPEEASVVDVLNVVDEACVLVVEQVPSSHVRVVVIVTDEVDVIRVSSVVGDCVELTDEHASPTQDCVSGAIVVEVGAALVVGDWKLDSVLEG